METSVVGRAVWDGCTALLIKVEGEYPFALRDLTLAR
jgi:hypothetical protein